MIGYLIGEVTRGSFRDMNLTITGRKAEVKTTAAVRERPGKKVQGYLQSPRTGQAMEIIL